MRIFFLIAIALALAGCGGKNYKAQLDFLSTQIAANQAAEASRADRTLERETLCAGLTDAGAISACMLGITASTLAERSGSNGQPQIVMPPAPPRSGLEVVKDLAIGTLQVAVPGFVGIRQSENQRDVSIANSNALYGFLGASTQAWTGFGTNAVNGMAGVSTTAVEQMRGATGDVAAVLPLLRPSITQQGTGNMAGDHNTATIDQSRQGRDRFGEGAAAQVVVDQSTTGRDRTHQEGVGNRLNSDDIRTDVRTRCVMEGREAQLAEQATGGAATIACQSEVP